MVAFDRRSYLRLVAGGGCLLPLTAALSATGGPSLSMPSTALTDREVTVVLDGLDGSTLTLRASAQSRDGSRWESHALFDIGPDGSVVVSGAPTAGTYERADPMGPFWSMRPAGLGPDESPAPSTRFRPASDGYDVTVVAEVDGRTVGETTTRRQLFDPAVESRPVDHDDLVGELSLPPNRRRAPAVVHLHGVGGRPHRTKARLLASHGVATLALQYFGDPDPLPTSLREVPVETVGTALEWLRGHDRVGDSVGLFGFSRGGTLALLGAARYDVDAVVGWVPSGVVWEGLDADRSPAGTSAWSVDGEPVDYLPMADADPGPPPAPGLPYFEPALADASETAIDAASVPVEQAAAPISLVSVTDDRRWPSKTLCDRIVARLDERTYDHAYRHASHEGAGHFISLPYLPTTGTTRTARSVYGGRPGPNARANERAWTETVSFFRHRLGA